jgi:hypothetical protein
MSQDNGTAQNADRRTRWKPGQVAEVQAPILRALGEVLEKAYPRPGIIIEALNESGEVLAEGLYSLIGNIINLEKPCQFQKLGEGCTVLADDADFPGKLKLSNLEIVPVLEEGETSINGHVLRERAKRFTTFGRHAGQFFLDNWYDLPREIWEIDGIHIALPGTIMRRDEDGMIFMEYINRSGMVLLPGGLALECDYGPEWYFLRLKKR